MATFPDFTIIIIMVSPTLLMMITLSLSNLIEKNNSQNYINMDQFLYFMLSCEGSVFSLIWI